MDSHNAARKTFLVSAYACEPGEGSEPGVGWNWVEELSKHHNVIVITRMNNKKKIEEEFRAHSYPNLTFYYCDVPKVLSFWKKGQRGVHLYYLMWQVQCFRLAKALNKKFHIDYSMTVTFGNLWMPTFMHLLPCEFIWGPLGGGEGVPDVLLPHMPKKQLFAETIRKINKIFPVTNPWFYSICKKAKLILVRTNDSLECIPRAYRGKCEIVIETGISDADVEYFNKVSPMPEINKDDMVLCGKMVPFKLFSLAIDAYAKVVAEKDIGKLHIIGDGPQKDMLVSMVEKYDLADKIIFEGKKTREDTLRIMAGCKALLLSSAREGGSWVMFEAMLLKKPIICFDTSGMSVVVNDACGYMIPVQKYDDAVTEFAKAISACCEDHENTKGENGYSRVVSQFKWSHKVERMLKCLEKHSR